jgi:hypothetical protein
MRLLLAIIALFGIAQRVAFAEELPFTLEGDHVVVDAAVDGKRGRFVVDTGSGSVVLDGAFAAGLNLSLNAQPGLAIGAGQTPVQIRVGRAREIRLDQSTLDNATVSVLPPGTMAAGGRKLDGTLGYDFFARWTVTIDFPRSKLTLHEPQGYAAPSRAIAWRAKLDARIPIIEAEFTAPGAAPVKARLAVDTGTARFPFLLSPDFAARLGLDDDPSRVEIGIGFGTGGVSIGHAVRFPAIDVGDLELRDVAVGIPSERVGFFGAGVADGTFGQGVLRRGVLTIDYARKRLLFEPGAEMAAPFDVGEYCGWLTTRDHDGDWSVAFVAHASPAEAAGLRKGDTLLALAGRPAASLVRDDLINACREAGPLELKVRRDTQTRTLTMVRRKLI